MPREWASASPPSRKAAHDICPMRLQAASAHMGACHTWSGFRAWRSLGGGPYRHAQVIGEGEGASVDLVPQDIESQRARATAEKKVRTLMARELHDRVAQTLTAMLVDVEKFKAQPVAWDDVLREMDTIQSSTREVLTSLRQLLYDLRDESSVGDSFVGAVRDLLARFSERTRIEATVVVQGEWPALLTPAAALNLYRIVEEALSNVRMHSGASRVGVRLEEGTDGQLAMVIDDNGRGVDANAQIPGLGTVGMKERALLLGGHLKVSSENGGGTTVRVAFAKQLVVPAAQPEPRLEFIPQGALIS
jgi:signal transduction histidine kinase